MKKALVALVLFHLSTVYAAEPAETVVLLHGIARTANSLKKIDSALQKQGYETLAITYPSTHSDLKQLAEYLHKNHLTKAFWASRKKVHFVTHSMGGLVAQHYLNTYTQAKVGRVVMLGPPNGGSEIADVLHHFRFYQWFYGPAGNELTTTARRQKQWVPYYAVGIIAGSKQWPYFIANRFIPGKSDGRVSVRNTMLEGMTDHITLPTTHSFMMNNVAVQQQILYFLNNATFDHSVLDP